MLQELDVRLEQAILTDLVQVCVCVGVCAVLFLHLFFVSHIRYTASPGCRLVVVVVGGGVGVIIVVVVVAVVVAVVVSTLDSIPFMVQRQDAKLC